MRKTSRLIQGVVAKRLKVIRDNRGRLMEILRSDDKIFKRFGQCYITTAYPKVIKAWHYHRYQDDHFTCVQGRIRLALFDGRRNSPTFGFLNEFRLSLNNPLLVKIPKGVYHGFKAESRQEAMVINIPTKAYNHKMPDELRVAHNDKKIGYRWSKPR
jgi:dTDP-4-dehydrorhamnose 3,5-epimerase